MTDDKPSNGGTNLTKKQQAFVDEYLIDLNGAQAAIRAGYSENTAKVIANENLTKPYIKQAIEKALEERKSRVLLTQDQVLKDIALIKQAAMLDKIDSNGNKEMVNFNAALKACELEGKHLAMFTDKVDATVTAKELPASVDEFV